MSKYSTEKYLSFDPFGGDKDCGIVACRSVKMVKVRKPHPCHMSLIDAEPHPIPAGDLARVEKSLYDGEWMSWYCCIPCMDEWIGEWE